VSTQKLKRKATKASHKANLKATTDMEANPKVNLKDKSTWAAVPNIKVSPNPK